MGILLSCVHNSQHQQGQSSDPVRRRSCPTTRICTVAASISTDMCTECCVVCIVLIMCMQLTCTPNIATCFCLAERLKGLQSTSTLGTIAEDPINLDSDSDEPLEYEFEESTTLGT